MPTEVNYVEGKWLDHEEELLRRRTELLAEKKKDITMATTTDDAFAARLIDPSSSSASASPNDIVRNQIISPEIVTAADGLLSLIGGNAAVKKQGGTPNNNINNNRRPPQVTTTGAAATYKPAVGRPKKIPSRFKEDVTTGSPPSLPKKPKSTKVATKKQGSVKSAAPPKVQLAEGIWTEREHDQFEQAVVKYGWGDWVSVTAQIPTREKKQVKSHAQKFDMHHRGGRKRLERAHAKWVKVGNKVKAISPTKKKKSEGEEENMKKRKSPSEEEGGSGDDDPSPTKKKRYVKLCTTEGCANKAQNGGVCIRHGAKMKQCTSEGCLNRAVKGGVCKRHGADVDRKKCTVEDCTNLAVKGGMCKRHGDCNTANFLGKIKHILCTPVTPSAVTKRKRKHYSLCSNENCNKYAQRKGVCIEHGAIFIRRRCTVEGCKNGVKKRGLCRRHGAYDGETPPS